MIGVDTESVADEFRIAIGAGDTEVMLEVDGRWIQRWFAIP